MAAVEVTISGVLYDKIARTTQPVVLIGEASLTGLGVGGGPVIPPTPPTKPPEPPLGIWPGPGDPDFPGRPPTVWPGPGDPDFPGGGRPPIKPPGEKPPDGVPPIDWKVVWSPAVGWVVVGIPNFPHPAPSS